MFGHPIKLFRLFGFSVQVDQSWFVLAFLIVWSLAAGFFPFAYPGLSSGAYLAMGVAGAVGLFLSIVFHELWHSLVARRYGLPMRGITLFIFGGIAEMEEEPLRPKVEALMAASGPAASVVVGVLFRLTAGAGMQLGWPLGLVAVLRYLGELNLLLAAFNLLPAFPLDGGRLLRAALWAARRNMRWATRVASTLGAGFGVLLMVLGVLNAVFGNLLGGMWWFVIGLFLRGVARGSYEKLLLRESMAGQTIDPLIDHHPPCVQMTATVQELVDDFFLKFYHRTFPVIAGDTLVGCVSARRLHEVPRERWATTTVARLLEGCGGDNTVGPGLDIPAAARALQRSRNDSLIVATDSQLIGTVDGGEILRHLAVRLEVEEAAP